MGRGLQKDQDSSVFIVTASPECYVRLFFEHLTVIGTRLLFGADSLYAGVELNCFAENKMP